MINDDKCTIQCSVASIASCKQLLTSHSCNAKKYRLQKVLESKCIKMYAINPWAVTCEG